MREILFRGKRTKTGEWVSGLIWHHTEKASLIYSDELDKHVWVHPETVGQFTGKTVKNGKVFDGDILKSIDGIFLVRWDEEKSAFVMRFLEYPFETLYLEEMWDDAEIIGNIHDNPELLENP